MINLKTMKALIKKDLLAIINDKMLLFSLSLLPIFLSFILPILIMLLGPSNTFNNSIGRIDELIKSIDISHFPKDIKSGSEPLYVILMYFFIPLFLMIPIIIATLIGSSSILGEKENKTLEGLLYTPLTNKEIILGKILASAIPAIIVTIIFVLIYGILLDTIGIRIFGKMIFPNLNWVIIIFLLNPLIVFLTIALILLISQYTKTSKSAQSISGLLIIPLIASIVSQASGCLLLGINVVLTVSGILLLIDIFIFLFISKRLNREKYILNND